MNEEQLAYGILGAFAGVWFIILALAIFMCVCKWKIFKKMGVDGWKGIIPIYNAYVQCELTFGNGLYFLGIFVSCIPFGIGSILAIIWAVIMNIRLAKSFGKSVPYAVGLTFLPVVFMPMLAFGSAQYNRLPDYDYHNPFN